MATNTLLTTDEILSEALLHFENQLTLSNIVSRDYEKEYEKPMKVGDTIRIRRPVRGTLRTGATLQAQDITEGRTTLTVATQVGADLEMQGVDMTLKIDKFGERYLKPNMITIANAIDIAVHTEIVKNCPNWVGTPGQVINSFSDYSKGPQRLDEYSVPVDGWAGILSPSDNWGLAGSVTALSANAPVKSALEEAKLTRFARTDVYMSQNVIAHTVGVWGTTPLVNNGTLSVAYATCKDTYSMTLSIDGLTNTTGTVAKGDVFTIAGVYGVNPVTKAPLSYLQQFVALASVTADGSGQADVLISPPIIISGAYQTCTAAAVNNAAITYMGTASTAYSQNLILHPDAVTLAVVPMETPRGAKSVSTRSYKGLTMRLIEFYDGINDRDLMRFDVLYGVKAIQPHMATRISGTP